MQLKYVTDDIPGITRKKGWTSFVYRDEKGEKIRNKDVLARIRSLAIPPAYTDVWICPFMNGHVQATARDARKRKQYIYHPDWITKRDEGKFHRLLQFAQALPRLRRRITHDLALPGMPKEKVLATIVKLLDTEYIRIGNDEYAKENDSFGLTTLQNRHVKGTGTHMKLVFKGKHGIVREVALEDERLRKIVATCQDIPGHELFEYLDDRNKPHDVKSEDVNEYLKSISHEEITAKDFRTWHGTVLAASYLWEHPLPETKKEAHHITKEAIKTAAEALGNTAAICKKCYVHPQIISLYEKGNLLWVPPEEKKRRKYPHLHMQEVALITWLEKL
ncbi:MAG: DNA topoisomerase IB [Patescibacteria group bacterium]